MVTVTPSTRGQYIVAIRSGLEGSTDTSDDLLKEWCSRVDSPLPPLKDLNKSSAKDPVQAAVYFDEMSHAVFKQIFGWDLEKHCAIPGGGLLRDVEMFAGGVETQGDQTLHWHILYWWRKYKARTAAAEAALGEAYRSDLINDIDSLITTELPIFRYFESDAPAATVPAAVATGAPQPVPAAQPAAVMPAAVPTGASVPAPTATQSLPPTAVPIPSPAPETQPTGATSTSTSDAAAHASTTSAHTPHAQIAPLHCPHCTGVLTPVPIKLMAKTNYAKFAPVVASCPDCKTCYSHVSLRKEFTAILCTICSTDAETIQQNARLNLLKPAALVAPTLDGGQKRQPLPPALLAAVRAEVVRVIRTRAAAANGRAPAADPPAGAPPAAPFQTTLGDAVVKYLRAELTYNTSIVRAYEHRFEHTNSCFSRGLVPGCKFIFCRYCMGFDCHCSTTIGTDDPADGDELIIKRQLGANYMNPVQGHIFALTKSNCNVTAQRGRNASYCTKYSAKPQDKVDSNAVLDAYIAGVKRTYNRRLPIEDAQGDRVTDEKKAKARLFSFMYHRTAMDEVAVTLAAWFLLKNSPPMYSSHACAPLMLYAATNAFQGTTQVRRAHYHHTHL